MEGGGGSCNPEGGKCGPFMFKLWDDETNQTPAGRSRRGCRITKQYENRFMWQKRFYYQTRGDERVIEQTCAGCETRQKPVNQLITEIRRTRWFLEKLCYLNYIINFNLSLIFTALFSSSMDQIGQTTSPGCSFALWRNLQTFIY